VKWIVLSISCYCCVPNFQEICKHLLYYSKRQKFFQNDVYVSFVSIKPPPQGPYMMAVSVCLAVCLSVCLSPTHTDQAWLPSSPVVLATLLGHSGHGGGGGLLDRSLGLQWLVDILQVNVLSTLHCIFAMCTLESDSGLKSALWLVDILWVNLLSTLHCILLLCVLWSPTAVCSQPSDLLIFCEWTYCPHCIVFVTMCTLDSHSGLQSPLCCLTCCICCFSCTVCFT